MELSTIIPDFLLRQPNLLTVYCYLARLVRNGNFKTIVAGEVISLRPYEHADTLDTMTGRTGLSMDELKASLHKLHDLQLITLIKEDRAMHAKLNQIVLPQAITQESSQKLEYNDCWLQDFIAEDEEWLITNRSAKTLENAQRVMKLFQKFIGKMAISQLRPDHLENFKSMRKSKVPKISNNTISIDVRTIKAAFERAVRRGRLASNPFRHVESIRCPKKKMPYFTQEEISLLLHKIKEPWLKGIISFAVLTCMRRGEIINLLWKDVHFDDGNILIQSSEEYQVKQGGMRRVPISGETLRILQQQKRDSAWVFSDINGQRFSAEHVSKKFKEYVRICGFSDELHFHSLRATGASWMISKNAPIYAVKEILGHASVKTTEPYATTEHRALREAVKKIAIPLESDAQGFATMEEARKIIQTIPLPVHSPVSIEGQFEPSSTQGP